MSDENKIPSTPDETPEVVMELDLGDQKFRCVIDRLHFIRAAFPLEVVKWTIMQAVYAAFAHRVLRAEEIVRDLHRNVSAMSAFMASHPGIQDKYATFLRQHKAEVQ